MFVGGIFQFYCPAPSCGERFEKYVSLDKDGRFPHPPCKLCSTPSDRYISNRRNVTLGPKERVVMWEGKETDENGRERTVYRNPMDPSSPMPKAFRDAGYQRVEYDSIQKVQQLERASGTINERLHFDRGSGTKRMDGSDAEPQYN